MTGDVDVRAALESLLENPPAALIQLVRERCGGAPSAEAVAGGLKGLAVTEPGARPQRPEVLEAYRAIERYCLDLAPDAVNTRLWQPAVSVSFLKGTRPFCDVALFAGGMRLRLADHVERAVRTLADVEWTKPLIREAFEAA